MFVTQNKSQPQESRSLVPEPLRDAIGLGREGTGASESDTPRGAHMVLGSLAAALTLSMPPKDSIFDKPSSSGLTDLGSAEAELKKRQQTEELGKLAQVGLPPGVSINDVIQQARQIGGSMASLTEAMLQLKERLGREQS